MTVKRILTLDVASRSAWALGDVGEKPIHGAVQLRRDADDLLMAPHQAEKFLSTFFSIKSNIPDMILCEKPLERTKISRFDDEGNRFEVDTGPHRVITLFGLVGGFRSIAEFYGIRFETVAPQTWQAFVLGRGKRPSGKELKRAVRKRLQTIGYFPWDLADDDRSDAVGIWFYAESIYGRRAPSQLFMQGEEAFA